MIIKVRKKRKIKPQGYVLIVVIFDVYKRCFMNSNDDDDYDHVLMRLGIFQFSKRRVCV